MDIHPSPSGLGVLRRLSALESGRGRGAGRGLRLRPRTRKRGLVRRERGGRRMVDLGVVRLEVFLRKRVPGLRSTRRRSSSRSSASTSRFWSRASLTGSTTARTGRRTSSSSFASACCWSRAIGSGCVAWDFVHCAPQTEHIFVGAGNGPCVILMAGARSEDDRRHYPVSELAARYGASVKEETSDPDQAYAGVRVVAAGAALVLGPPALGLAKAITMGSADVDQRS